MMFMSVRCHFHFNDCKEDCQRAARQQRFGSPLIVSDVGILQAGIHDWTCLLCSFPGMDWYCFRFLMFHNLRLQWGGNIFVLEDILCCKHKGIHHTFTGQTCSLKDKYWFDEASSPGEGETNNNRLYKCRQPGSMHGLEQATCCSDGTDLKSL